jgi:hypothetical protein
MYKVRFPSGDTLKLKKDGKPYADGRKEKAYVLTSMPDCADRVCYQPMQDKGAFVQGRGYVRYYDKPRWVCQTNHLWGCPPEEERGFRQD